MFPDQQMTRHASTQARRWLLSLLASAALGCLPVGAADLASEQAVRAVLVFKFLQFTEWSATTDNASLRICVSSHDPELMTAMQALRERQVRGKPLTTASLRNPADCDVIYVDSRGRWNGIAAQQLPRHALTIGGYPGFIADGGMIEIALQEGGARFDINLSAAKHAELRFYPQLLRLARRVVE
jgi:hypothetical protein